jgi:molybdenum cofactor guanylyltransferase
MSYLLEESEQDRPFAVLLAGGQGARMGYVLKAGLVLDGKTLLEHVTSRMRPDCAGLLLSLRRDTVLSCSPDMIVVQDDVSEGPISGLLTAMDWLRQNRPGCALVSAPVDTPFLPSDYVIRLSETGRLCCARTPAGEHPLHSFWPVSSHETLRRSYHKGERAIHRFLYEQKADCVDFSEEEFLNINTWSEWQRANGA